MADGQDPMTDLRQRAQQAVRDLRAQAATE